MVCMCHVDWQAICVSYRMLVGCEERLIMLRRGLTAVASTRSKLSDNARKLFDLAMQSSEFKKMMVIGVAVIAALYVLPSLWLPSSAIAGIA